MARLDRNVYSAKKGESYFAADPDGGEGHTTRSIKRAWITGNPAQADLMVAKLNDDGFRDGGWERAAIAIDDLESSDDSDGDDGDGGS